MRDSISVYTVVNTEQDCLCKEDGRRTGPWLLSSGVQRFRA